MNRGSKTRIGVLAAILSTFAAMQANASVVTFQNPPGAGHFDWGDLAGNPNALLDIRAPASVQPPLPGSSPAIFAHSNAPPPVSFVNGTFQGEIEVDADSSFLAASLGFGQTIPSGLEFMGEGVVLFDGFGTNLPEGEEAYLAVSFESSGSLHYGWIGVIRTGHDLDAFAWGYETEPGVPIAAGVPEPTTLALFALAAGSLFIRRRRRFE